MSRYLGPRLRITRRLGNLIGLTRKKPTMKPLYPDNPFGLRKIIPPGQHGRAKLFKKKPYESNEYDFLIRLKLKQRLRFYYGITEKQLLKYVQLARKSKGSTGRVLLRLLEMRLDNIVFRLHMAPTIQAARQLISHGHILVNKKKVTIPSYQCKPKDLITVAPKIRSMELVSRFLTEFDMEKARFQRLVNILQFGKKGMSTSSKLPQKKAEFLDSKNRSFSRTSEQQLKLHSLQDITVQRAGKFEGQGIGYINNKMVIIEPLFAVKDLIGQKIKIAIYDCVVSRVGGSSKQKKEVYYAYPTGPISMDFKRVSRANSYDLVKYLGPKALILMDAASSDKNRFNTDSQMKSIRIAAVRVLKNKPKRKKVKIKKFEMLQSNKPIVRENLLQNKSKFAQLRQKDPAGFREKYIYGNYSSSLRGANIRFYAQINTSSKSQNKASKNMSGLQSIFNKDVLNSQRIHLMGDASKRKSFVNNVQPQLPLMRAISNNPLTNQKNNNVNLFIANALGSNGTSLNTENSFPSNVLKSQEILKKDLIRNELEKCSNYINQLNEYKTQGLISETVYTNLKQKLINNFFVPLKKEYLLKATAEKQSLNNNLNKNSMLLFAKLYKKLKNTAQNQKLGVETPELSPVFSGILRNLLSSENKNNNNLVNEKTKKAKLLSLQILSLLKRRANDLQPRAKADLQSYLSLATLIEKSLNYLNNLVSHPLFDLLKSSPIFEKNSSIEKILEQGNKINIKIYQNLLSNLKVYTELAKLNKLNELVLKNPSNSTGYTSDNLRQKIVKSKETLLLVNENRKNALYQEIIGFIMVCLNRSNGLYNVQLLNEKSYKNLTNEKLLEIEHKVLIKKDHEQKTILNNAFLLLKPLMNESSLIGSGQTESLKNMLIQSLNEQKIYQKWVRHNIIFISKQEQILNKLDAWTLKNNLSANTLVQIKQSIKTRLWNEQEKRQNEMLSVITELNQRGIVGEQFIKQMKALVLKTNINCSLNNNTSRLLDNLSLLDLSLLIKTDNLKQDDFMTSLTESLAHLSEISYQKQFQSFQNSLLKNINKKDSSFVNYDGIQQKVKNRIQLIFKKNLYTSKLNWLKQQNKLSEQQYSRVQQNIIKQLLLQKGVEKTNLVLALENFKTNKMINNTSYNYLKTVLAAYSQQNKKALKSKSEGLWSQTQSLISTLKNIETGSLSELTSLNNKFRFEQEQRIMKASLKVKNNLLLNGIGVVSACPNSSSLIKSKLTNNLTEMAAFNNLWNSELLTKQDVYEITKIETLCKLEQLLNGQLLDLKQYNLLKNKFRINSSLHKDDSITSKINSLISELSTLDKKLLIEQTIFAQLNEKLLNLKSSNQSLSNVEILNSKFAEFKMNEKQQNISNDINKWNLLIINNFLAGSLSPLNIQKGLKTLHNNNLITENQYDLLIQKVSKLQNLYVSALNYKGSKMKVRNKQYRVQKVRLLKEFVLTLSNVLNNSQLLKLANDLTSSSLSRKQITEKIKNNQKYERWNNQRILNKTITHFVKSPNLRFLAKDHSNQTVFGKQFKQILENKLRLALANLKTEKRDLTLLNLFIELKRVTNIKSLVQFNMFINQFQKDQKSHSSSDLTNSLHNQSLMTNPESFFKFTRNNLLNEFKVKWVSKLNKLKRNGLINNSQYIFISREFDSILNTSFSKNNLKRLNNLSLYCENLINTSRVEQLKEKDLISKSANLFISRYLNGNIVQKYNNTIFMNPIKYRIYQNSIVKTNLSKENVLKTINTNSTVFTAFKKSEMLFIKNVTKTLKESIYLSKLVQLFERGAITEAQFAQLKTDRSQKYVAISKAVRQHMQHLELFDRRRLWKFINYSKYESLSLRSAENLKQKANKILSLIGTRTRLPGVSFGLQKAKNERAYNLTLTRIKNLLNRTLTNFSKPAQVNTNSLSLNKQIGAANKKSRGKELKGMTTQRSVSKNNIKNKSSMTLQRKKGTSLAVSTKKKSASILALRFVRVCQHLVNNLVSNVTRKSQRFTNQWNLLVKKNKGQELQSLLIQKGAFETLKQLSAISSQNISSRQKQIAKQKVFEYFIAVAINILQVTKGNTLNDKKIRLLAESRLLKKLDMLFVKNNKTTLKNREILNKLNSFANLLTTKQSLAVVSSLSNSNIDGKIKKLSRLLKIRNNAKRVVQLRVLKYGALRTQLTYKLLKNKLLNKLVQNIQTQKAKSGFLILNKLRFINKNRYRLILSKIKLKAQKQKISSVITKMGTLDLLRNPSLNKQSVGFRKVNINQKAVLISAIKTLYQLQQQKLITKRQYQTLLQKIKLVSKYAFFAFKLTEFRMAGLITAAQYAQFSQKIYQKVRLQIRSLKILQKFKLYTKFINKIKLIEAKLKKTVSQQVSKNKTVVSTSSSTGLKNTKNYNRSSNQKVRSNQPVLKEGFASWSVKPLMKSLIKQTISKKSLLSAKQGKWNFILLRQLRRQKLINQKQYKQLSKAIQLRIGQNNQMIRNLMQNLSKLNQSIQSKLSLSTSLKLKKLRITLINSPRSSLFKNISLNKVWNLGMLEQLRRRKLISASLYNKLKQNILKNVRQSSKIILKNQSLLIKNASRLLINKKTNKPLKDNKKQIKTYNLNKSRISKLGSFKKVNNSLKRSVLKVLSQKERLAINLFKLYAKRASRLQKLNQQGLITNLRYKQKLIQIFRSILKLEKMNIVQQSKRIPNSKFNRILKSSKLLVYWISAAHQVMSKKNNLNLSKKGKNDSISSLQKAKVLKITAYKQAILALYKNSLIEEANNNFMKRAKSFLRPARLQELVKSGLISQKQYLLLRNRMKKALLRLAKLDKLQETQNKLNIAIQGIKVQQMSNLVFNQYKALYSKIINAYLRAEFKFIESDLRKQTKKLNKLRLKQNRRLLRSTKFKNSNLKSGKQLNPFLRTLIAQLPPKRSQKINTILRKLRQKLSFDENLIKKIQPQLIKFIEKRYGPPLPIPPHLVLKRWKILKPISKEKSKLQGNKKYFILPVGIVRDMASRKAVGLPILERLIVEYYSRK